MELQCCNSASYVESERISANQTNIGEYGFSPARYFCIQRVPVVIAYLHKKIETGIKRPQTLCENCILLECAASPRQKYSASKGYWNVPACHLGKRFLQPQILPTLSLVLLLVQSRLGAQVYQAIDQGVRYLLVRRSASVQESNLSGSRCCSTFHPLTWSCLRSQSLRPGKDSHSRAKSPFMIV